LLVVIGHCSAPLASGSGQIAQQKSTLWIGINPNRAVTTVWRTKPGTMLSIGLNYSTTDTTAYFRCLSLLSECPRRTPTEFLFRMEPHRGTPVLQKLRSRRRDLDNM
jgi:hypothetical protein